MPQPPALPTRHHLDLDHPPDINRNNSNHSSNIVDVQGENSSGHSSDSSPAATPYLNRYLDVEPTSSPSTTDDYLKLKEEFYQSYDPEIGLHTAAVLGGILGWLIVYLLYKTKVKKCVVGFFKKRYKKRKQRRKEKTLSDVFAEYQEKDFSNLDSILYQQVKSNHIQEQRQQLRRQFSQPEYRSQPPAGLNSPPRNCPPHRRHKSEGDQSTPPSNTPPHLRTVNEFQPDSPMRQQHQRPMPSIVVESYSSLPHAHSSPSPSPSKCPPQRQDAADRHQCPETLPQSHKVRKKRSGQDLEVQGGGGGAGGGGKRSAGKESRRKKYQKQRSGFQGHRCPEVTVLDVDEADAMSLLLPPCAQDDSARATARWVQTMPLWMRSQQDVTGLILKIQPSMVGSSKQQSCPLISAALQWAALPLLGPPNVGWNNSMPHLADNGLGSLKDGAGSVFSAEQGRLSSEGHPNRDRGNFSFDGFQNKDKLNFSSESLRNNDRRNFISESLRNKDRGNFSFDGVSKNREKQGCENSPKKRGGLGPGSNDLKLLQPCLSPASRPQSSLSHKGRSSPCCIHPVRTAPCLTITIPDQKQLSVSSASLAVPGSAGHLLTGGVGVGGGGACSAPTSPIPIPVTPTVTIQNCTSRVPRSLQHMDSQDSFTSSSSLEPLLQLHNDCHCPSPQHSLPQETLHRQPPTLKSSPRSSWTVFDDADSGGGGGGGGGSGGSGCSRQNSYRSNCSSSSPRRSDGTENTGRSGPHDTILTLETKL
ncbi:uncharacterized protein [Littorina saxatilis]